MLPALSWSATTKPAALAGATAARQSVQVTPPSCEIYRLMWSPAGPPRSQRDEVHRPGEARIPRCARGVYAVGQPAVGRLLDDRVARLLLVVAQQHRVVVEEGHPLPVRKAALVRLACAEGARREVVTVVGGRRGGESGQRPEARVGVLEVAEAVRRLAGRDDAVAASARTLLAARRRTEQVELVAAVGRDLRVVCGVGEPGRAAGVDIAGPIDLDQGLGLVTLRIGGDGSRELEPLGGRRGQRRLDRARRRLDLERARVLLRQHVREAAGKHVVSTRRQVEPDYLLGRARSVARAHLFAVRTDHGQDLVRRVLRRRLRRPVDRERERGVDRVVGTGGDVHRDHVLVGGRARGRRAVARGIGARLDSPAPGVGDRLAGGRRNGHRARRRCRRFN